MSNLFEASKRESAVDLVVNSIKQLLMERTLKPGDKLPSELEISEELRVSRGSVREAMKILTAFGLVDIRVGNGTYVCETPGNTTMDSLLFSFFISNQQIDDLYEFRHIFEIDILTMILEHYDDNGKERKALRENLEQLERLMAVADSGRKLSENDLEFHRLLGQASKNLLAERVYNFIIDFMEPSIAATHKGRSGEIVYELHRDIVDLIESRDAGRIDEVITNSVDTWSILQPSTAMNLWGE